MQSKATSVEQYLAELPPQRQPAMTLLCRTITHALPEGFVQQMSHGMIGWVVPHTLYPAGYHCDPKLPLPFMSLASQKQAITVYHMGLVADSELLAWFTAAHDQASPKKLDMGKCCIRYRKPADVPHALIGELASRMTPAQWIARYERETMRR